MRRREKILISIALVGCFIVALYIFGEWSYQRTKEELRSLCETASRGLTRLEIESLAAEKDITLRDADTYLIARKLGCNCQIAVNNNTVPFEGVSCAHSY